MKMLILSLFISTSLFAKEYKQNFKYEDFYQAKTAKSSLRFDMKSTKLGMMTTDFYGVVKDFTASFSKEKKMISSAVVKFKVEDLDTDVNDRNKKMYKLCFESKKYPFFEVLLDGPLGLNEAKKVAAILVIRGKKKKVMIDIKTQTVGNKVTVSGKIKTSIKYLEIPDPSIWIAKVEDSFDISFSIDLDL